MAFSFSTPPGGTSSSSGFSLGGTSTPTFGASSSSLPKTASTPSFFGGGFSSSSATNSTAATGSGGLFGTPIASGSTSTPSFSFSGSQGGQQTTPSFGMNTGPAFGSSFAKPASMPGFSFSSAASPSPSLFGGASQSQPSGQIAPMGFGVAPSSSASVQQAPDDSAIKELQSINDAFVAAPGNHKYRFQYLFLNVVENESAKQPKPNDVDELQWREAIRKAGGKDNPDNLWPTVANGFQDLIRRKVAQDEAIKEHQDRLGKLESDIETLVVRQNAVLQNKLNEIRWRHSKLCQKLLRFVRYIDALEGRYVSASGNQNIIPHTVTQRLRDQLSQIESALAPGNGGGLRGNADALIAAARLRSGGGGSMAAHSQNSLIDPSSLENAFSVLSEYAAVLETLQEVLKRDIRDVDVLDSLSKEGNSL